MRVKLALFLAFLTIAALAIACPYVVPTFKLQDHSGKVWTEKMFTVKPTILVFLKDGCPANPRAIPLLNDLQRQIGTKAQVICVTNASVKRAKAYAKDLKANFPMLSDEKSVLIKGFGATRSLEFSVVATTKEARWAKLWPGIGRTEMGEAVKLITGHKRHLPELSLDKLPEPRVTGCSF